MGNFRSRPEHGSIFSLLVRSFGSLSRVLLLAKLVCSERLEPEGRLWKKVTSNEAEGDGFIWRTGTHNSQLYFSSLISSHRFRRSLCRSETLRILKHFYTSCNSRFRTLGSFTVLAESISGEGALWALKLAARRSLRLPGCAVVKRFDEARFNAFLRDFFGF